MLSKSILNYIQKKDGDFNSLALAVFQHQYENCEAYHNYCNQVGSTPNTIKTWQAIPPVSTEVFREFTLSTFPVNQARHVFETSGTSKQNKGKHYYQDMSLYDAAIQSSFLKRLALPNHPKPLFRVLSPFFLEVSNSSLGYMFHKIVAWYGDSRSTFYCNEKNELDYDRLLFDLKQDIECHRPIVLLGTAFSYVNFFDYLNGMQLTLPEGSKLLETGGLKGRTRQVSRIELYRLFEYQLGLNISNCYSEYGMTELSSQCYSKPNSHLFQSPHWMQVRMVDPENGHEVEIGEVGLIQFFDLANLEAVSAVITSDLGLKQMDSFELLGRAPKAVLRGCSTAFENEQ